MTYSLAFLQNLSSWEILLIFMVVLLFFGAKRLPDLAKSLGKSMREFKNATSGIEKDIRSAMNGDEKPESKPSQSSVESTQAEAAKPAAEGEDEKKA